LTSHPLKYAVIERERRFLLRCLPEIEPAEVWRIRDRYLDGTRLRLREVEHPDGSIVRKLGHKVRLGAGPRTIACTSNYLDDPEWDALCGLPGRELIKTRHRYAHEGGWVNVDLFADGSLLAEVDDGDGAPQELPEWLVVLDEVTDDEQWTGAGMARR
jgi:hypothetical protein